MNVPKNLLYSRDHEWVRVEGNKAYVGITDYAQHALGDMVFVELPSEGDKFGVGDACSVVESVKAASDIYAPLSGTVVEVNSELEDNPGLINQAPYESWILAMELTNVEELKKLLPPDQYEAILKQEA